MADPSERGHANLCEFIRWMPRLDPAARLLDTVGVVAMAAPLDWPTSRLAVRASTDADAARWVDAAEAFLFSDGKTACIYAREGADDDITDLLLTRGFTQYATLPEMVCASPRDPRASPSGFDVRLAKSDDEIHAYAAVAGEAFAHLGMPADELVRVLRHPDALLAPDVAVSIARRESDGTIVAGAMSLIVGDMSIIVGDEPNGYVAWVACADSARGNGLGDAVTRLVTNEAFERGAQLVSLEASPYGRNTYDRMGYDTVFDYRLLVKV